MLSGNIIVAQKFGEAKVEAISKNGQGSLCSVHSVKIVRERATPGLNQDCFHLSLFMYPFHFLSVCPSLFYLCKFEDLLNYLEE